MHLQQLGWGVDSQVCHVLLELPWICLILCKQICDNGVAVICKVKCIVNSSLLYEVDLEFITFHISKIGLTEKG